MKLKEALEEDNFEMVKKIMLLLLDVRGGYYYYNFKKTNLLLEAETIYGQAIKYLK